MGFCHPSGSGRFSLGFSTIYSVDIICSLRIIQRFIRIHDLQNYEFSLLHVFIIHIYVRFIYIINKKFGCLTVRPGVFSSFLLPFFGFPLNCLAGISILIIENESFSKILFSSKCGGACNFRFIGLMRAVPFQKKRGIPLGWCVAIPLHFLSPPPEETSPLSFLSCCCCT